MQKIHRKLNPGEFLLGRGTYLRQPRNGAMPYRYPAPGNVAAGPLNDGVTDEDDFKSHIYNYDEVRAEIEFNDQQKEHGEHLLHDVPQGYPEGHLPYPKWMHRSDDIEWILRQYRETGFARPGREALIETMQVEEMWGESSIPDQYYTEDPWTDEEEEAQDLEVAHRLELQRENFEKLKTLK
jgi:hypothetical protein